MCKCSNKKCNNILQEGDRVYQEKYYYSIFCSVTCLVDWSSKEYEWTSGKYDSEEECLYGMTEEGLDYKIQANYKGEY